VGFLRRTERIEHWLTNASNEYRALSEREYRSLTSTWRQHFEAILAEKQYVIKGVQAQRQMESHLGCDVFVFSMPGYRLMPSATDPQFDTAYAHHATALQRLDWDVANPFDAIVVDGAFSFTCLCTHEADVMAHVQFVVV